MQVRVNINLELYRMEVFSKGFESTLLLIALLLSNPRNTVICPFVFMSYYNRIISCAFYTSNMGWQEAPLRDPD